MNGNLMKVGMVDPAADQEKPEKYRLVKKNPGHCRK